MAFLLGAHLTRGAKNARGLALIAVLWMVAALSIVVSGMGKAVRNELRTVSVARQMVAAGLLGDAAIHLVLQDILTNPQRPTRLQVLNQTYHGVTMSVQVLPLSGLIDVNAAPPSLLESLFRVAGGMTPKDATALAQAAVELRSLKDSRGRPQGFAAIEDLLRVPGLDYPLYASIQALVTTDLRGNGRVNPMAAPLEVLAVLAEGNQVDAMRIAKLRDAGATGIDISRLNRAHIEENSPTQRFRLQAQVPLNDGAWVLRVRTVDLSPRPQDDQPWRIFRVEQRIEPALGTSN